jgi:hypothetical protein
VFFFFLLVYETCWQFAGVAIPVRIEQEVIYSYVYTRALLTMQFSRVENHITNTGAFGYTPILNVDSTPIVRTRSNYFSSARLEEVRPNATSLESIKDVELFNVNNPGTHSMHMSE